MAHPGVRTLDHVIAKMSSEYGELIATLFHGELTQDEALMVATKAACALACAVRKESQQIATATRDYLHRRSYRLDSAQGTQSERRAAVSLDKL